MEYEFLRNRNIILFTLKPWDSELGGSINHYAKIFTAHNNKVLVINRALDRTSIIRFRNDPKIKTRIVGLRNKEKSLRKVQENLWVLDPPTVLESVNKIPFQGLFDFFNRINNKRLARQINIAAAKLGFKDIILYIDNDFIRAFYLKEMIDNLSLTVYYIRDFLTSQSYFKGHGQRLEPLLIKKANLVSANSIYLMNYARKFNNNSFFVGQGCNLNLFSGERFPLPADMSKIPRPIIGYAGALITTRLSIEILKFIAEKRKEWSIVLVGPEDQDFRNSDLHDMPNVFFLGRKAVDELPTYISHFDVCINPQVVNEMTIGNYPLKIDEYLAMGKPIVATRTEAMEMFEDFVTLCTDKEQYIEAISKCLVQAQSEEFADRQKAFGRSHTWENCVGILDNALLKTQMPQENGQEKSKS